jgi:hypothetical protein
METAPYPPFDLFPNRVLISFSSSWADIGIATNSHRKNRKQ